MVSLQANVLDTTNCTLKESLVNAVLVKECTGVVNEDVTPSPKLHAEPAVAPVELFVIVGVNTEQPEFTFKLNEAVGFG